MTGLSRRAQQVWRARGGWTVAAALAVAEVPEQVIEGGSSHFTVGDQTWRTWFNRKAMTLTSHDGHTTETYPWRDLTAHAATLAPALRAALVALRTGSHSHQIAFPVFAATAAAQGCGRAVPVGPLTKAQALYTDEYDRWQRHRHEPWQSTRRALEYLQDALLDLALPLANDTTPVDLLELLEARA